MAHNPNRIDPEVIQELEGALWNAVGQDLNEFLEQVIARCASLDPPTCAEVLSAYTHIAAYMVDHVMSAYDSNHPEEKIKEKYIPEAKRVFQVTLDFYQTPAGKPNYTRHKKVIS